MEHSVNDRVETLEIERDAAPEISSEPRMVVSAPVAPVTSSPRQSVVRETPSVEPQTLAKTEAVHSPEIVEIVTALAIAQGEFDIVEKNRHAEVQSRREGARSYSYDYEDLASVLRAVRPALSKNALAIVQLPTTVQGQRGGGVSVLTILAHGPSGQWFRNRFTLACDAGDPQAVGSALTYARRYALKSILGLASEDEDDDGERARISNEQRRSAPRPAQRKSQQPTPASDPAVLTIVAVVAQPGGWIVKFSDGRHASTRDRAMADAAERLRADQTPVDVTLRASSDPKRFAATIEELTPLR